MDGTASKKERKIFKLFRPGTLPDWIQRRSVGRRLRRKYVTQFIACSTVQLARSDGFEKRSRVFKKR
jgi:hypothetical protein